MDDTSNHILLTEEETAALLQPHAHNKSIRAWLAKDRQQDPVIPFVLLQGEPYYRESDVVDFIIHALDPSARFVRVHNHLATEHRESSHRRRHADRRRGEAIQLQPGIERRRRDAMDRRLRGDVNRRSQATTQ
jgi:hypothetical protein